MAKCYSIKRSFAHEGVFYSPGDAHKLNDLPQDKLAEFEKLGLVDSYDDTLGVPYLAADDPINVKAAREAKLSDFKPKEG